MRQIGSLGMSTSNGAWRFESVPEYGDPVECCFSLSPLRC